MTLTDIAAFVGAGGVFTLLGWLVKFTIAFTEVKRDAGWLKESVTEVKKDVEWIKETMNRSGKRAGKLLHSPHTPNLDQLIEKFWREELGRDEVVELLTILEDIQDGSGYENDYKMLALKMLEAVELRYKIHLDKPHAQ